MDKTEETKNTVNSEILDKVKKALGIFTNAQDDTLNVYIDGIKSYMKSAGVSDAVLSNEISCGCIVAGVIDTWQLGGGTIKLSPYTKERIIQLKNEEVEEEETEGV
ncbi:MAG: phage head-tail connector protein [Lachnospiraceae bacterium]|nr:phage head-tail connector protein [Lachnospiraceae bacterium]